MVLAAIAEAVVAVAICRACRLAGTIVANEINQPSAAVAKLVLRPEIPNCSGSSMRIAKLAAR